jgi:hypothetical protein
VSHVGDGRGGCGRFRGAVGIEGWLRGLSPLLLRNSPTRGGRLSSVRTGRRVVSPIYGDAGTAALVPRAPPCGAEVAVLRGLQSQVVRGYSVVLTAAGEGVVVVVAPGM